MISKIFQLLNTALSYLNPINSYQESFRKKLEWVLIILSSVLLGIWAVKDTIALRNILLVIGTLFSIYYIIQEWRYSDLKKQSTNWRALPILLVALTFFWVISHYLFFSLDPVRQLEELESTWLRSLMASIIGLATGRIISSHPNRLNLLWLGILIAFLILLYQYIPRALAQEKLLVPDYDYYLFHLKFNAVLMGMILIAGIDGALLDHLRVSHYRYGNWKLSYLLYWLICTSIVLWSFVYIIDTRNGIGLSIIFYGFWLICAIVFFMRRQIHGWHAKSLLTLLVSSIGFGLILFFLFLQTSVNKGWHTFLKDASIAVQIDRYPNWQNLSQMGYPKHDDGQAVVTNNYERVAWAVAGSRAIIAYPQGVGVLKYPFAIHLGGISKPVKDPANASYISTHSGWVELGLAYGIPILAFIFSALLLVFVEAARHSYPARMTILGFVVLIVSTFTVTEVGTQHSIEILFYFLTLIPALLLTEIKAN
jgi:hypothetical protein